MKKPFFSIAIPTYNRCRYLKSTIDIILHQTFQDFEIVVVDNASSDQTMEAVKHFKDQRVKYFCNRKNIGFPKNTKKAINLCRGKYIFTTGDDDFILFKNTLSDLKKILDNKDYGFLRIDVLERTVGGLGLQKKLMHLKENFSIDKNASDKDILNFIGRVDIGTIAGLVFKNSNIKKINFLESEVNPWFNLILTNIRKFGAIFISGLYMVISWPEVHKHQASHDIKENKLSYESYNNELFKLIPKNNLPEFKKNYYQKLIELFPCTKMYTSNSNLIKYAKRILELEPSLKFSFKLWFFFIIALIFPRIFWLGVRHTLHRSRDQINSLINLNEITHRYVAIVNKYQVFAHR